MSTACSPTSSSTGSGARDARLDRYRAARRDRLVLASDEPGPGTPGGAGGGRHPGARPARRQPARVRPGRAAVPGGPFRGAQAGASSSSATSCCRATVPTGCSGARGSGELWLGTEPAKVGGAAVGPTWRRSASSRAGRRWNADPGRGRGRPGRPLRPRRASCRSSMPPMPAGRGRPGIARRSRLPGTARPVRLGPRPAARLCSTSTTSGRSTSRQRNGAGATTSCRSCSAIASSAGSNRGSSGETGDAPGPRPVVGDGLRADGRRRFRGRVRRCARGARALPRCRPDHASSDRPPPRHRVCSARAPRPTRPTAGAGPQRLIRMTCQGPQLPALSRARTRTSRSYALSQVMVREVEVVTFHECHVPPTRRRWTW